MNKENFKKIAYPETYADEKELHDIFTFMRREDPVSWVEPDQFRPFWAITKHEDITVSYTHLTLPTICSV